MTRDIVHVLVLSSVAQVAGFGKAILITYYFGVGTLLDGYYLAQTIPAMLAGVLVGFFQTGFTPHYSAHVVRGEHEQAASLLGGTLLLAGGIGLLVSVAISVLASPLVTAVVGAEQTEVADSTVTALRALAFLLLLNALVDCLGLALNAHQRYMAAAAAPTLNALLASAILIAAPEWGLTNLIVGTLLGVTIQLIVVLVATFGAGIRVTRSGQAQLMKTLRTGASILPGLACSNLALLVPSAFAARIGEGAVTAFSIASRMHGALTQVLAIAVSTVLLPHFARAVARNESMKVAVSLRVGFPMVAAIGVAVVMWIAIVGRTFVGLLFERGAFDPAATLKVASAWLWLAVGLVPVVWGVVLAKTLQALQLGRLLSAISVVALIVLVAGCAVGAAFEQLNMIAFATALSAASAAALCAVVASKQLSHGASERPKLSTGLGAFLIVTTAGLVASYVPASSTSRVTVVVATMALVGFVLAIARSRLGKREGNAK